MVRPAYVYFRFIGLTVAGMGIMGAKGLLSSLFGKNIIELLEDIGMNVFNRGNTFTHLPEDLHLSCQEL